MKKGKIIIGATLAVIGIGSIIIFLKGKKAKASSNDMQTKAKNAFEKYIVNTESSALNIRKQPNLESEVSGTLEKGSQVLARPFGNQDWLEYSVDGSVVTGYVSSEYLKKSLSENNR